MPFQVLIVDSSSSLSIELLILGFSTIVLFFKTHWYSKPFYKLFSKNLCKLALAHHFQLFF